MIVMRRVKIEVNRPKIGDRIRIGGYTATCFYDTKDSKSGGET